MMSVYNLRNPAVKRLMKEAEELSHATDEYHAQPLEDNLFEWHFSIRGPPNSDFEGGIYHGRITLPPDYPMKPPSIILLTPNGRFETNKKICLSISGYHPESWQPSWSIRTALLAIIGFMPTHGNGALGSLDYTPAERKELAVKSQEFKCPDCGSIKEIFLKKKSPELPNGTTATKLTCNNVEFSTADEESHKKSDKDITTPDEESYKKSEKDITAPDEESYKKSENDITAPDEESYKKSENDITAPDEESYKKSENDITAPDEESYKKSENDITAPDEENYKKSENDITAPDENSHKKSEKDIAICGEEDCENSEKDVAPHDGKNHKISEKDISIPDEEVYENSEKDISTHDEENHKISEKDISIPDEESYKNSEKDIANHKISEKDISIPDEEGYENSEKDIATHDEENHKISEKGISISDEDGYGNSEKDIKPDEENHKISDKDIIASNEECHKKVDKDITLNFPILLNNDEDTKQNGETVVIGSKRKIDFCDSKSVKVKLTDETNDLVRNVGEHRKQRDECSIYGKYVASHLRKYNTHTQSVVKHLISNILFQADISQLNLNNSSASNSHCFFPPTVQMQCNNPTQTKIYTPPVTQYSQVASSSSQLGNTIPNLFSNPAISGLFRQNPGISGLLAQNPGIHRLFAQNLRIPGLQNFPNKNFPK